MSRARRRRRAQGAPFAYAVGRAAFRHLTLDVDERVLIPRPETEQLVDDRARATRSARRRRDRRRHRLGRDRARARERGTFDACSAPTSRATRSPSRARTSRRCAPLLRAPVELPARLAARAAARATSARVVVVQSAVHCLRRGRHAAGRRVRDWEPAVALFSGGGGMAHTARLVREAADVLEPGDCWRWKSIRDARRWRRSWCCRQRRYRDVAVSLDLAGRERFVLARRQDE